MSFVQLRNFVTVAEEGCVSRAAKRLAMSQPPLTRQLRALEEELQTPLFKRNARGVELLPAGHRLLAHAREILAAVARAEAAMTSLSREPQHSS